MHVFVFYWRKKVSIELQLQAASRTFSPGPSSRMSLVPKVKLSGGLEICRVLNGMWQVSGAHGAVDKARAGKHEPTYGNITVQMKTAEYRVMNN